MGGAVRLEGLFTYTYKKEEEKSEEGDSPREQLGSDTLGVREKPWSSVLDTGTTFL